MTNERIIEIAKVQGWGVDEWDGEVQFLVPDFFVNEAVEYWDYWLYRTPYLQMDEPLEPQLREAFTQLYQRTMFASRGEFDLRTEQAMMRSQATLNSLSYLLMTIREDEGTVNKEEGE